MKLLSFTHRACLVNLPKRHLDRFRRYRFTSGRIWPNCYTSAFRSYTQYVRTVLMLADVLFTGRQEVRRPFRTHVEIVRHSLYRTLSVS